MTKPPHKSFGREEIHLSNEEVVELARRMQAMQDSELNEDQEINQELIQRFKSQTSEGLDEGDPSCLNDDQLWEKIQGHPTMAQLRFTKKSKKKAHFLGWSLPLLAAAATLVFMLNPWKPANDSSFTVKGVFLHRGLFDQDGCAIALKVDGGILELDSEGMEVPASSPALLLVRCKRTAYLHLRLESGQEHVNFMNLNVRPSPDWQMLDDETGSPLGFVTPSSGTLKLTYGLSELSLSEGMRMDLEKGQKLDSTQDWLWIRLQQWPIKTR